MIVAYLVMMHRILRSITLVIVSNTGIRLVSKQNAQFVEII